MTTSLHSIVENARSFLAKFDHRLDDVGWLHQKFHADHHTIEEIADTIGCTPEIVRKKLLKHDLLARDKILDVYTGRFHSSKQLIMKLLKKRYLGKIEQRIDEVYPRIETNNALVLKDIFTSMVELDRDAGVSAGGVLGMSRKETYELGGKFGICLFDYDSKYEELGNYFLREIIRRRDEFEFDEACSPENWYPHRDMKIYARHLINCRKKKE